MFSYSGLSSTAPNAKSWSISSKKRFKSSLSDWSVFPEFPTLASIFNLVINEFSSNIIASGSSCAADISWDAS